MRGGNGCARRSVHRDGQPISVTFGLLVTVSSRAAPLREENVAAQGGSNLPSPKIQDKHVQYSAQVGVGGAG